MKQHFIAFLETVPEDELTKMLNWAYCQQYPLDNKTPYEQRTAKMIEDAIYHLEKPE